MRSMALLSRRMLIFTQNPVNERSCRLQLAPCSLLELHLKALPAPIYDVRPTSAKLRKSCLLRTRLLDVSVSNDSTLSLPTASPAPLLHPRSLESCTQMGQS